VARFEAERQALALMDHPNIARVFDGGTTDSGRPFFVMELVKGLPLTEFCDQNRLTPRERLELFLSVCQAVQHAHQKGIIHRDLKPSNVLVTLYDDNPVPKVIDFGVAKAIEQKLTEQTLFTRVGQVVGTLEYMSPEQASLNALDVDTRSDVYALGVLLYELLTGTTPLDKERLQGVAFLEMLRLIREEEPPRPSTRLSGLGGGLSLTAAYRKTEAQKLPRLLAGELDWIAMKALEKDRSRRYETASAFAADVRRYLSEEPVEARPPSAGYRLRKFVKRNRGPVLAASVVLLAVLAGIAGTTWGWIEALSQRDDAVQARRGEAEQRAIAVAAAATARTNEEKAKEAGDAALRSAKEEKAARKLADEERRKAELARKKAEDNENIAEWRLYASRIASAQREWETDNLPLLYHYLNLSRRDFRGWEHDYLYTLANQYQQVLPVPIAKIPPGDKLPFHHAPVSLAFSADGKRLGMSARKNDPSVTVWDLANDAKVLSIDCPARRVAFSPNGTRIATAYINREAKSPIDLSLIKVWDASNGKEIMTLKGAKGIIWSAAFSHDGKLLAGASLGGTVKLWDMDSGKEVGTLQHHQNVRDLPRPGGRRGTVLSVAFSPDGKQLATAGETVKVWDIASGKELMTLKGHNSEQVTFSHDGKRLASGSSEGTVKVWELAGGQEVFTFKGFRGHLAFSPDSKRLASGSDDGIVKVWELVGGQEAFTLKGALGSLAFTADGTRLASFEWHAGHDGVAEGVKIWQLGPTKNSLTLTTGHNGVSQGLAFSPDGKQLAGLSRDNTLKLWEVASGREIRTFTGHTDLVTSVAFSPDGKQLASASVDKTVKLWDPTSAKLIRTIGGHANTVKSVAYSPDGNYLASAERSDSKPEPENCIRVWELATGKEVRTMKGTGGVLAFSPNGKSLATTYRGVVKAFDLASSKEIMTGKGPALADHSVAFSPDGKRLVGGGGISTVRVWDLATGALLMKLPGHTNPVLSVAFSPDGKRLASASSDTTVKLWDATSGQEVLTLKGHTAPVWYMTFSPDGKRLASASMDGTIKIWDASKSMKETHQK
jgi:WD40 repeat protein